MRKCPFCFRPRSESSKIEKTIDGNIREGTKNRGRPGKYWIGEERELSGHLVVLGSRIGNGRIRGTTMVG